MAEFNSCASLINKDKLNEGVKKYTELLANGHDPFLYLMEMQNSLQEDLASKLSYIKKPRDLTKLGDIYEYIRDNKIALDDEFREVVDALAGVEMAEKDRSALWKKWKTNHNKISDKTLDQLTNNELKELKFEYIDMLHFFINIGLALKIDACEIFVYYYYKNIENARRYANNY